MLREGHKHSAVCLLVPVTGHLLWESKSTADERRETLGMKVKERRAWRGGQEPRKRRETGPTLGTEHEVITGDWLLPLSPVLWRCPQGATCLGGMFLLIVV